MINEVQDKKTAPNGRFGASGAVTPQKTLCGFERYYPAAMAVEAPPASSRLGVTVSDHFADVGKTIPMPKGAEKEIDDILLTCYACYP